MCGICGVLYFDQGHHVDSADLEVMNKSLYHRGPDDDGMYVDQNVGLAMRRLSIIDVAGGHQPIHNEDRSIWVVFNGEIYNFQSVRSDLQSRGHKFNTGSDTEVIVHLYEEYGDDCVQHLNGMFAIAIWDTRQRRLFLARDRAGEKPLYYYIARDRLVFASELKAILTDASVPRVVNPVAVDQFLSFMYVPAPATIFQDIFKLPPAHTIAATQQGVEDPSRYWSVPYIPDAHPRAARDYADELRELLLDSVEKRMISEVPLGVFLSGGIDSSAITALAVQASESKVRTFSVAGGTGDFDELPYARQVAEKYDTDHHEFRVEPDLVRVLPDLVQAFDEPFADSSAIPMYYVCQMARQHITVALSGEGSDEIFSGYGRYLANLRLDGHRRKLGPLKWLFPNTMVKPGQGRLVSKWRTLGHHVHARPAATYFESLGGVPGWMKQALYQPGVLNDREDASVGIIEGHFKDSESESLLNKMLYADYRTYLPDDLLTKVDRMSMIHSLEVRTPFLDHRVIELAARIPPNMKQNGNVTKHVLRLAVNDLLPESIQRRGKWGFGIPVQDWMRTELKAFSYEILTDRAARSHAFFQKEALENLLEDHASRVGEYGYSIWALLVFELWCNQYLN